MRKVNLAKAFASIQDTWTPHIVEEIHGCQLKLVRCRGEFVWHHHEEEEELFLVVEGSLCIDFPEETVTLKPGEFCTVPRGMEHRPFVPEGEEALVLLVEPRSIQANTGSVEGHALTKKAQWLEEE